MKKKNILTILLICCFLISFMPFNAHAASENLGIVPDDWGDYHIYGNVHYSSGPQITFVDSNVLRNGHVSIRIEPHSSLDVNVARELNAKAHVVKAGDRLYFGCWMKTGNSTLGQNGDPLFGARVSFDYYDDKGFIDIKHTEIGTYMGWGTQNNYVPFGTNNWTYRSLMVTVPSDVVDVGDQIRRPTHIVCWMQVLPVDDGGFGWFADAEFYINRDPSPSPTVDPTPSPTVSPTIQPTPLPSPTVDPTIPSLIYPTPRLTVNPTKSLPAPTHFPLPTTSPRPTLTKTVFPNPTTAKATDQSQSQNLSLVLIIWFGSVAGIIGMRVVIYWAKNKNWSLSLRRFFHALRKQISTTRS